ncbi:PhnB protein [Bradyrhizobium embrapense]
MKRHAGAANCLVGSSGYRFVHPGHSLSLRQAYMTQFKPAGRPSVIPRIVTRDLTGLAGFLRDVFGAEGEVRPGAPTEIRIGDSIILISDGGGVREAMPAFLYVYVENADETYRRAIAAGAETIEAPANTPYGDRRAMVRDASANVWQIATYRGS